MEYTLVRSKRKTVALQINAEGELIVRAPMLYSERKIKKLVEEHREWIENKKEESTSFSASVPPIPITSTEPTEVRNSIVGKKIEATKFARTLTKLYRLQYSFMLIYSSFSLPKD